MRAGPEGVPENPGRPCAALCGSVRPSPPSRVLPRLFALRGPLCPVSGLLRASPAFRPSLRPGGAFAGEATWLGNASGGA